MWEHFLRGDLPSKVQVGKFYPHYVTWSLDATLLVAPRRKFPCGSLSFGGSISTTYLAALALPIELKGQKVS